MKRSEIKKYIKSITGIPIKTDLRRCPWDEYQFMYFKLSTGIISAVRTLLDREFVNRRVFGNRNRVKDFFIDYSKGKTAKDLKWFDFFASVVQRICAKNSTTLPEIVAELHNLSGYLGGREGRPPCPPLTEAQIVWGLIRRYGTSFNSFLTELQVVEEMADRLASYGLKARLATIEEDIRGVDFVVFDDDGNEYRYNLKASKYDESKDADVRAISMSRYADTGDLQEEHYQDILRMILEDIGIASKEARDEMPSRGPRFRL